MRRSPSSTPAAPAALAAAVDRDRRDAAARRPRPRSPRKRSGCSRPTRPELDARAARHLPHRGRARCSTRSPSTAAMLDGQSRRSRGAAHGAPAVPYAEGQRPHGRARPSSASIAFDVEKIHNRLLEEERVGHAGGARDDRRRASRASARGSPRCPRSGRVAADPAALHAAIAAVEAELPPGRESALTPTPPAPPRVARRAAHACRRVDAQPRRSPLPELELAPTCAELRRSLPGARTPIAKRRAVAVDAADRAARSRRRRRTSRLSPRCPNRSHRRKRSPATVRRRRRTIRIDDVAARRDARRQTPTPATPSPTRSRSATSRLSPSLFGDSRRRGATSISRRSTHELAVLQFDPRQCPSAAMVRASHTLCGIHRTGGFPLIAADREGARADACSRCSSAARRCRAPRMPVLARAVEGLRALVGRVQDRARLHRGGRREAAEIQRELEDAAPGDGTGTGARRRRSAGRTRGRARRARRGTRPRRRRRPPLPPSIRCRRADAGASLAPPPSTSDAAPRRARPVTSSPRPRQRPRSSLPAPADDPLADIRDDVDQRRAADLPRGGRRALSAGRRAAARVAPQPPDDEQRAASCAARCTRSRAARGWRARCAWASSRT